MEVEAGAVFVVPPVFFGCEDLAEGKQKQKDFFFQVYINCGNAVFELINWSWCLHLKPRLENKRNNFLSVHICQCPVNQ